MHLQGHNDPVMCIALSPDEYRIISSSVGTVRVWDPNIRKTSTVSLEKRSGGRILSIAISPDGRYIVCIQGSHDRSVRCLHRQGIGRTSPRTH